MGRRVDERDAALNVGENPGKGLDVKAIFTLACVLAALATATVGTASAATHPAKSAEQRTVLVGKIFGTLTGTGGVIEASTP
jgi:hypothetical protein